ncbi:Type I restriction-modification system, specificity subunit S [Bacillus mycoides]|nr:Type I restriction-modification system, specificity subunit S [Bacillus mycoides]
MVSKKKVKSVEELLEEVLVSEEEQPYDLPENWIWAKFENVFCQVSNSNAAVKLKDYLEIGKYPVVDQSSNLIGGYTDEDLKYTDKLPVIVFGDHTKNIKWIDFDFVQGADGTKLLSTLLPFNKYYYYLLKNTKLPDKGYSRHFKYLREKIFPIAPIDEQIRIVTRIEKMLTKIEQAQQLIEEAKETFELRQAAILEGIFKELNQYIKVGEIAQVIDPQPSHRTPPRTEGGIPYIGIKDCDYEKEAINFGNARPVSETVLQEHIERYDLYEGDFIIGKIGTVGNPFILPINKDGQRTYTLSANVLLVQPDKTRINPKYLYYLFKSNIVYKQINENINSTTQAAFGIKKAREISIPICSLEKQKEIVEILDKVINKEKEIVDILNNKINISVLKSSILSKAFKGELGTNNPNDESAIELLKSTLQEKL